MPKEIKYVLLGVGFGCLLSVVMVGTVIPGFIWGWFNNIPDWYLIPNFLFSAVFGGLGMIWGLRKADLDA